jgi:phage terminase large subunit GpA-like protein
MKSPSIIVASVHAVVAAVVAGTLAVAVVLFPIACATTTPAELTSARSAFARGSAGAAAQLAPADLRRARLALDQAERAFAKEHDRGKTVDFAYVAERTVQIAEAHAETAISEKKTSKATRDLGDRQGEIARQTAGTLTATRAQLAEAQLEEAAQAQQIDVERAARKVAEQKAGASEQPAGPSKDNAAASERPSRSGVGVLGE